MTPSRTAIAVIIGVTLVGAIVSMTVAPTGFSGELTEHSPAIEECPSRMDHFRQTDSWYVGRNRILVEAKTACGSRYGDTLDLEEVRLSIFSGTRSYAVLRSSVGAYDKIGHKILLGPTREASDEGCLRGIPSLLINLKTGELRTPGLRLMLAENADLPVCTPTGGNAR